MAISMLKIRRPLGRLIFNMGIAIPGKTVFLIETAPRLPQTRTDFIYIVVIRQPLYTVVENKSLQRWQLLNTNMSAQQNVALLIESNSKTTFSNIWNGRPIFRDDFIQNNRRIFQISWQYKIRHEWYHRTMLWCCILCCNCTRKN